MKTCAKYFVYFRNILLGMTTRCLLATQGFFSSYLNPASVAVYLYSRIVFKKQNANDSDSDMFLKCTYCIIWKDSNIFRTKTCFPGYSEGKIFLYSTICSIRLSSRLCLLFPIRTLEFYECFRSTPI